MSTVLVELRKQRIFSEIVTGLSSRFEPGSPVRKNSIGSDYTIIKSG